MTAAPETKPWYRSKGMWGAILAIVNGLGVAGLQVDPATGDFSGNIYDLGLGLAAAGSGAYAAWGRLKASTKVTLR